MAKEDFSRHLSENEPIALVGISCRFPGGADDPGTFWQLLCSGLDAVTEIPADRWDIETFYQKDTADPGKTNTRWGGFIEGIDRFDAGFFRISPREAAHMDPQQRLLLELAWEALEDSGQIAEQVAGSRTGVFVGASNQDFGLIQQSGSDLSHIDTHSSTGGAFGILANRVSHFLDLRGPSFTVDTACSSSLVALHLGCRSLWSQECSMALIGGVNLLIHPGPFVGFSRSSMLSPDGRCKAFDAAANGYVRGEGAGFVLLKPLARAIKDEDQIYALIRSTAVNQDGHAGGITVPGREAQQDLLQEACQRGRIAPHKIQFVEAHGTGTPVGDPIEALALGRVLGRHRPADSYCIVGSVKTNIGHLEPAAGIAGLIKTALCLRNKMIPANLHFDDPNPNIPFQELKLRVPKCLEPWPVIADRALAAVCSFGFGGSNAVAILEETPQPEQVEGTSPVSAVLAGDGPSETAFLVPLSARSPDALPELARSCHDHIAHGSGLDVPLEDICWTAAMRRDHHEYRLAVSARNRKELIEKLGAFSEGVTQSAVATGRCLSRRPSGVVYVCSGQGPQWWGMGRQLLATQPVFRQKVEQCDALVRELGGWSPLEEMTRDKSSSRIARTSIAQPAIFCLQLGLAELWNSWGIRPDAVVGHSVGEVAASHLCGALSLEEAVQVVFHRSRCMDFVGAQGRMLAVAMPLAEAEQLVHESGEDQLSLAAVNGPALMTLSGNKEVLEGIAQKLENKGIFHRFLEVEYAFHSHLMDPARDPLLRELNGISPRSVSLPMYSTVRGDAPISGPELDADYWWSNVRQPVRFATAVDQMIGDGHRIFLELSPHPVLSSSISDCASRTKSQVTVLQSLRRDVDESVALSSSLGALYTIGYPLVWQKVLPRKGRFTRLPTYCWQREPLWSEPEDSRRFRLGKSVHPLLGRSLNSPNPSWENRLYLNSLGFLRDHQVQGSVVLPSTAYVEVALAVGREMFGADSCLAVDKLRLSSPCFPTEPQPTTLRTIFDPDESTVRIYSRPPEINAWTALGSCRIRKIDPPSSSKEMDVDEIRNRCSIQLASDECYDRLLEMDLQFGKAFQAIDRVWCGSREVVGLIHAPREIHDSLDCYRLHPAMLDACFQTVGVYVAQEVVEPRLLLPVEVKEARVYGRSGEELWCHARLVELSETGAVADIQIFDKENRVLVELKGARCQAVAGGSSERLGDLLFEYQWVLKAEREQVPDGTVKDEGGDPPVASGKATVEQPGKWLILVDQGGVGERLASHLRSRGEDCLTISVGAHLQRIEKEHFELASGRVDEIRRIIETTLERNERPLRGVVHLWNLDLPEMAEAAEEFPIQKMIDSCLDVVELARALDDLEGREAPRLWLVTQGAHSVDSEPSAVKAPQGLPWGLGRVLMSEKPKLRPTRVDLSDPCGDEEIGELCRELWRDDEEDEIALRGKKRFVLRYRRRSKPEQRLEEEGKPADDRSFKLAIPTPGSLDRLIFQETDRLKPGPGQVEIEVAAAGLNFADLMKTLGIYPGLGDGPIPLGAECSGTVVAVGEGVQKVQPGDQVIAVAPFAIGSFATTSSEVVFAKPAHLNLEEAATVPIAFLTAHYALDYLGRLMAGERILIHSASGGVGLAAVQIAKHRGAEVYATAGSEEKREFLRSLGIEHVMDSRSLSFAHQILEATNGEGVDMILNSLAGEAIEKGLDVLADYGRFLEIGKRDIYQDTRIGLQPFRKKLSFVAIDLDAALRERPTLIPTLFRDVIEGLNDRSLSPLPYRTFPVSDTASALRTMSQAKHIGKIVVAMKGPPSVIAPSGLNVLHFQPEATYLITGGLGGFGLVVAEWMVEKGAGHLVLMGRGEASSEALQVIERLEARGARVAVKYADVADRKQVANVLRDIDESLPPLRGVFHAAAVFEDCVSFNLNQERMRRVWAPKVQGAWNLHVLTLDKPLDYFVLFSSVAAFLGNAGQAGYVSANAYLDSLAFSRKGLGLPATAIGWGRLGQVGWAARNRDVARHLESIGILSLRTHQALGFLSRLLREGTTHAAILKIDWQRWQSLTNSGWVPGRIRQLIEEEFQGRAESGIESTARRNLLAAPAAERLAMMESLLRDRLAQVLGTTADNLDMERPVTELGLDSLMGIELRNWIEKELRTNLPSVELLRGPSIARLAELLVQQLNSNRETEIEASQDQPRDVLAELDNLSEEEVDTLLAESMGTER